MLILPICGILVYRLVEESSRFYSWFKSAAEDGSLERVSRGWREWPPLQFLGRYVNLDEASTSVSAQLTSGASSLGKEAGQQVLRFFAGTMSLMVGVLFFVLFLYYFLKEGPRAWRTFYHAIPLKDANKKKIYEKARDVFEAVIKGQLLSAFI